MLKKQKQNIYKKLFFTFSYSILILLFCISCGKYEEGPSFSLISKKKRLVGDYIVEKYFIDDNKINMDEDLGILNYKINYNDDGTGSTIIERQGDHSSEELFEWRFDEDKEYLHERLIFSNDEYGKWITNKKIIRLTKNELWVRYERDIAEDEELHLKKQ